MLKLMIAISTADLERRIHRFEVGEAKLAQLDQMAAGRQPGEQEAIEGNLKATRKELIDMRNLYAQRLAAGPGAPTEIAS